ncbi:MAG: aminoglycoside phosphotransferase family protein [Defluviitaleaceae bacterium]|nr:aminoglycoside phosphotransferase family protein [Defluviitaleaceae bacterium]
MNDFQHIADNFDLDGYVTYFDRYGNGHINTTYLAKTDKGRDYIFQKINKNIFKDVVALMRNISSVTRFQRESGDNALMLVKCVDGADFYVDGSGEYWRVYDFVVDSVCLDSARTPVDLYESGVAFGRFQKALGGFDASQLFETIPRFHDTPNRYEHLLEAITADKKGRLANVRSEVDFAMARREYAGTLMGLLESGELPLRVTHNDTKLNNVLLHKDTGKPLCVIDLDTVMPGLAANDFGDAIRFGANTAAEDEVDLSKVAFSLEMFEAFTRGFVENGGLTEKELLYLRDGAKMMTLECGVRFLTDYLNGDTYFKIHRPSHNLDRCRTQFKLVSEMEDNWDRMQEVINKFKLGDFYAGK